MCNFLPRRYKDTKFILFFLVKTQSFLFLADLSDIRLFLDRIGENQLYVINLREQKKAQRIKTFAPLRLCAFVAISY
ncbi:hypothetical protein DCO46_14240 [Flavobacterium sp. HTF]|nr:hypothetical protein DCO46_14240 [Flavobacterium sp. HTF]